MSCSFSNDTKNSRPIWSKVTVLPGNFSVYPSVGTPTQEVGYGEGGYGEDGYDTPSSSGGTIGMPSWSTLFVPPCLDVNSAIILFDPSGAKWIVTVDTTGHLVTTTGIGDPPDAYEENPLIFVDSNGVKWNFVVNTNGDLVTEQTNSFRRNTNLLLLSDINNVPWTLTVLPTGNLDTSL